MITKLNEANTWVAGTGIMVAHILRQSYDNVDGLMKRIFEVNDTAYLLFDDTGKLRSFAFFRWNDYENEYFKAVYWGFIGTDLAYRGNRSIAKLIEAFKADVATWQAANQGKPVVLYYVTANPLVYRSISRLFSYTAPGMKGESTPLEKSIAKNLVLRKFGQLSENPFVMRNCVAQRYSIVESQYIGATDVAEKSLFDHFQINETQGDRLFGFAYL